jgi:putative flippase GtrA
MGALRVQVLSFAVVGALCTFVYLGAFVLLERAVSPQPANALALLLSALLNTAANRRVTFGFKGRAGAAAHQIQGLVAFAAGLAVTAGSLALLDEVEPSASSDARVAVLVLATVVATVVRFAILRYWVFAPAPRRPAEQVS